ncbi:MAG: biotin--[acetyl-CoA-carboxylase] ligase [Bacteroidales bacterium]
MKRIQLDSTASTNAHARTLIKTASQDELFCVIADYQSSGRGQGSHSWHSEPGKNLLLSLVCFPAFLSASDQFSLSVMTALSVVGCCGDLEVEARIKWPNDILAGNRKLAGILIENGIMGTKVSHSIIGIGLNVNQVRFPEFPTGATSLCLEQSRERDREVVLDDLLRHLESRYNDLRQGRHALWEEAYRERLHGLDQTLPFTDGAEVFDGIIRGTSPQGELLVERDGRVRAYARHQIRLKS